MKKKFTELTGQDILLLLKGIEKGTWIKIAIGTVAAAVFFFVLVQPAWLKRPAVKAKLNAIEGNIIRLQTLRRQKPAWEQEKADHLKYIQAVKDRLFAPGETALLLGKISRIADESHVSIIASTPHGEDVEFPEPFNTRYRAELYDFTAEGGYHELGDFISRIESYPKILRVELFHVRPREDDDERHLVDLTLSAVSSLEPMPEEGK